MSLVWTLLAGFLYAEIFVVLILISPIFSPYKWNRFFKSKFLAALQRQAHIYVYVLLALLIVFLFEALREINKYRHAENSTETNLNVELSHNVRLFRAQRNFYISGFALFLVLVIRRLVVLICTQASLMAQSEASLKQAQSATTAARSLMQEKNTEKASEATEDNTLTELTKLRHQIQQLTSELNREKKDKAALKSQSESLNKEYDRLTDEYSKLQNKVKTASKSGGKDD